MDILSGLTAITNLVTAVSYFWISIQSFLYLNKTRAGLDAIDNKLSEWVRLAVLFVFACGVHHLLMAFHSASHAHSLWSVQILADSIMAFVSAQAAIRIRGFLKIILPSN